MKEPTLLLNHSAVPSVTKMAASGKFKRFERTQSGYEPFSCSQSSTSGSLKRHERTHSGDKPFSYSQCYNKYSISSHLKRHERTHTGDKPFSCSQCDKNGQPQANLIDTKEPRAVINHSVAPCVTTNVYYQTIDIKEPTLVILTWWKKFQEWKHLVGSPSYGLSGQWDIINKPNLRHLSCFFRLNCH